MGFGKSLRSRPTYSHPLDWHILIDGIGPIYVQGALRGESGGP